MAACSAPVQSVKPEQKQVISQNIIEQNNIQQTVNQQSNVNQTKTINNDATVINVSDKAGASFGATINLNSFSTKASVSGSSAKQPSDVAKVDVYLLKLPSGFSGTDPLGSGSANVAKISSDLVKTGSSFNVLFKNVPGLATNQYWVGIVAKDSSGNVIAKPPTTAWTGQTATSAPAMALSTTGIGVDSTTLAVSSTGDLTVNISLLDAIGAQISSNANVTAGSSILPTISAQ